MHRYALLLLLPLLSACTTITLNERSFVHGDLKPAAIATLAPGYAQHAIEVVHPDGVVGRGVHLRRAGNRMTVLYFGGNEFRLDRAAHDVIRALTALDADVVIVDHRGYGRSDGTATFALLQSDALETFDAVRRTVQGPLVVHGHSLGSFLAAHVAHRRDVQGLVLEGSATNVDEWSRYYVPWYAKPFVRIEIDPALRAGDNRSALAQYSGPLLILVGSRDDQTPPPLSKALLQASASKAKALHTLPGADHGNVMRHAEFTGIYRTFLAGMRGSD